MYAFPQTSSSDIFDDGSYEKPVSSKRLTDDDDDDDVRGGIKNYVDFSHNLTTAQSNKNFI